MARLHASGSSRQERDDDHLPIVMLGVALMRWEADLFVASLARPGGNITGLTNIMPELAGKRLELLREVIPKLSRVAFLAYGRDPRTQALCAGSATGSRAIRDEISAGGRDNRSRSEIGKRISPAVSSKSGRELLSFSPSLSRVLDRARGSRSHRGEKPFANNLGREPGFPEAGGFDVVWTRSETGKSPWGRPFCG